tara:strand:+ start:418 stop:570 length:153 start_codon:yes stop_codon:yes gene_type:complete
VLQVPDLVQVVQILENSGLPVVAVVVLTVHQQSVVLAVDQELPTKMMLHH